MKHNEQKRQNTTTTVKNPNWPEANQLAFYECGWEIEPGDHQEQIQRVVRRVLNPGTPELKTRVLTTRLHCLHGNS